MELDRIRGRNKSSFREKIAWVRKHPNLWHNHRAVVEGLKEDGLISKNTYWVDVRVRIMIELAGSNE